ncbi:MAG: protein kinase, partial [Planctomycetes bacterium]|nr:protein kinase [Planctomycetota bacterium]
KVIHAKSQELFLGPYIIADKLGEGGMGRVYRARHVRIGREVALKIIRPNLLSNPIIRGRYEREVEAAGTLRHPNIVCVDDAGEMNGKYYMAMEFVDGVDLARLIKEHHTLEVSEACEYIRQAALGLQHAHDNGFVHRDIKPSNIIVAGERHLAHAKNPAIVKILDMGLVRPMGFDDVPGAAELTRAGTVVGTPDYMAPEQAKNSSGVDARADLYSLGCTLYFLLTAQTPYPDGTPIEKLLKHQLDAPPSARVKRPEVPAEIDAVITCLMAKKPEDRFSSAFDVAQVLTPFVAIRGQQIAPRAWAAQPVAVPQNVTQSGAIAHPRVRNPSLSGKMAPAPATTNPGLSGKLAGSSRTVPAYVPEQTQPVAPSDPTPRPPGVPAAIQSAVEDASPFATLADPPSVPLGLVATDAEAIPQTPPKSESRRMWWIVGGIVGMAVLAAVVVIVQLGKKPTPPAGPPGPPDNTTTPKRPYILPKSDLLSRLHHHSALIPDESGLVVVTFPSTFLKEKDSPFQKGNGLTKLSHWMNRLSTETGLDLHRTDRLVYSVPGAYPDRFFMISEGEYLSGGFAQSLTTHPTLRSFNPFIKGERPRMIFTAPGDRFTAFITPHSGAPVYAVMSNRTLLEKVGPRLVLNKNPPPAELDPGMMPALNVAAEKPPLLFAVVGEDFKFPFGDNSTLKEFGIELMTLRVHVHEKMELELTVTSADQSIVKQGLKDLAQTIRDGKFRWGDSVTELLTRQGTGERLDSRYRWTIKTSWTPEQFSTFLDHCLN